MKQKKKNQHNKKTSTKSRNLTPKTHTLCRSHTQKNKIKLHSTLQAHYKLTERAAYNIPNMTHQSIITTGAVHN